MSRGTSGAKPAGGGLGTRIMVSMVTILVLVTLLAGFCLFTLISQPPSAFSGRPPVSSASKPGQTVEKIAQLALEARTIEQQFRQQQAPVSVVQFEEASKNLLTQALELEKNAKQGDPKEAQAGAQVIQQASQYSTAFRDLVQSWEVKGTTEAAGLRKDLSQAALNLAAPGGPSKTHELEPALKQLDRAEQNYFTAPGQENQRVLVNTAGNLATAAEKSDLAASGLQAINKSIKNYITAFDRYQAVSLTTSDPALSTAFVAEQVKQKEAMHKAALELAKIIRDLNSSQAGTAVQTIRQQEQEYLAKGDAASAALVSATLDEYSKSLDAAQIPRAQKNAMKKAATEYKAAFTALVEQDKKITEQGATLDKTFTALQDRIKEIGAKTAPPASSRTAAFSLTPQLSRMIIAGGWLAIVLITLLVARMLTGSIISPLQRMTNTARRMADQGDTSLTFLPEKNEFGRLASALNALLNQQTARAGGSKNITAEVMAQTGDLARLVRDKVGHDEEIARVVAGQGEVLARLRTAVDTIRAAAESLSRDTSSWTEQGQSVREAAAGCEQSVTAAVETMQTISQSAEQMTTIINTFTDLAEQTSVMALNAAIKATRAGTQGNSFKAVTEELDLLAKHANETAKELTHLLNSMTARIADSDKLRNESRQALQNLAAISSTKQQAMDTISRSAIDLRTASVDTGTLLAELAEITRQAESLVRELETGNKETLDTLSFQDLTSGSADGPRLPLEEEMKKVLHGFEKQETGPDLTAGSSDPGDRT